MVLTRLMNHLVVCKIITPQQHLLKGNSTTSALIKFIKYLLYQMKDGNTTSAFFLDFSKAFDYRDHKFLEKDEEHGS